MADVICSFQILLKKVSSVYTQVTHWVALVLIQCATTAIKLVYDALLLLVRADYLLTSIGSLSVSANEH